MTGPRLALDLFDADAILLSRAAAQWLALKPGDELKVNVGTSTVTLKVAGLLPEGAYRQRLGVMDVGAAQWRLARLGRLNRIDLRLRPGTDSAAFRRELQAMLPAGVHAGPITYRLRENGKQFLVIAAGGHHNFARLERTSKVGDWIQAYTLP